MKRTQLFTFLFACFFSMAFAQDKPTFKMSDPMPTEDKLFGLSTLWKEASYNFVWFDKQLSLNWDSVYQAYIIKVLKANTVFEVNRVWTKFLEELKDGHTGVWVNQNFWNEIDQPPISLTRFEGKIVVYRMHEVLKKIVPLKSEILQINDREASEFLKNDSWQGFKGTEVKLFFRKPDGKTDTYIAKRNLNDLFKQGNFQYYPIASTTSAPKFLSKTLDKNIAFVQINTFSDSAVVDSFKRILPALKEKKALILDIRGNGGGNSEYALAIAKLITDKSYLVGPSWRTRTHHAANKAWGSFNRANAKTKDYPYKNDIEMNVWENHPGDTVSTEHEQLKLYRPVIILTSKKTFSAAEDFLIYLLGSKNIVRIGQASAGSSGQPLTINLPYDMKARICAKRDMLPDGTDYIGKGIIPDIEIPVKSIFSTDTKDLELEAALAHLKKTGIN